jgi:glycosyltransferase involved in cell wall biosynthesis
MNIKILHLLSNWKWTEISEPAVDLALAQKDSGAIVEFACGRGPADREIRRVDYNARQKKLDPVHVLDLPKHFNLPAAYRDCRQIRVMLRRFQPDIIHCHHRNAHLMGFLSRGFSTFPAIVASSYDPAGPQNDFRSRFLYKFATDGMVVINGNSQHSAVAENGFAADAVCVAEPGIDLNRFSPHRDLAEDGHDFGLKRHAFVVGIVSRIREARRLDIALTAVGALAEKFQQVQILVVGRGREGALEKVVNRPAEALGIADRVVAAGYCQGDRLVAALRAMDVLVYPRPGSDQSCRTVREAMAAGLPVVAPDIGFLPELIEDRQTGRLMVPSGADLAAILTDLISNPNDLREMASRALKLSAARFSMRLQAEKTLTFYQTRIRQLQDCK